MFYKGKIKESLVVLDSDAPTSSSDEGRIDISYFHIEGTRMVEAGIDGLSRVNNLGFIMIVLDPFN